MNFRIKQWPRKKHRKREVQKFENLEDKRSFFGKIKSISDNFYKSFILMAKVQIVGISFNCHNKFLYIKNLMHI